MKTYRFIFAFSFAFALFFSANTSSAQYILTTDDFGRVQRFSIPSRSLEAVFEQDVQVQRVVIRTETGQLITDEEVSVNAPQSVPVQIPVSADVPNGMIICEVYTNAGAIDDEVMAE